MGFIFGIVNIDNSSINAKDIRMLCNAVKWEDFEDKIETHDTYALGYCWNINRVPKAGIYSNKHLTVICDARIYNTEELLKDINFNTPEEAFAKGYLKWGNKCANKFNGDFSTIIINHDIKEVILFRDHIGVRPLCYTIKDNLLIFASHEFGIAKSNLIDNSISEETLIRGFFREKRQKYCQTVFNHIQKVVPGHYISISSDKIKTVKYWFPEKIKKNKNLTFQDATISLQEHLIKSTNKRIEPGILGSHVSGGLDSSGIAAIIADSIDNKNRFIGYSWSPRESVGIVQDLINEKEFIEDFAEKKKVLIKYYECDKESLIEDFALPEFEKIRIEMQTMRQANQDGVETLFSGWGGDEFVSLSLRGSINHIILRFKLFTLIRWINHFGIKATIARAKGEILPLFIPFGILEQTFTKRSGFKYFKKSFILKHWKLFFFNRRSHIYGWGNRTGFMIKLLKYYHLPQRMDTWALFGEKYGIEYKYPLLDKNLLEFWFGVPIKYTYEAMSHRYLYCESMKGILPEKIRMRVDKREGLLQKYNIQNKQKIKCELATQTKLFSANAFLPFFRIKEFQKLASNQQILDSNKPEDRKTFYHQIFDLQYYLKYKGLCEKYLANNQDLTNTRKE